PPTNAKRQGGTRLSLPGAERPPEAGGNAPGGRHCGLASSGSAAVTAPVRARTRNTTGWAPRVGKATSASSRALPSGGKVTAGTHLPQGAAPVSPAENCTLLGSEPSTTRAAWPGSFGAALSEASSQNSGVSGATRNDPLLSMTANR